MVSYCRCRYCRWTEIGMVRELGGGGLKAWLQMPLFEAHYNPDLVLCVQNFSSIQRWDPGTYRKVLSEVDEKGA